MRRNPVCRPWPVLLALLAVAAAIAAQGPERARKVIYTKNAFGTNISEAVLTVEDEPKHRLVQSFRIDAGKVSDPDFVIVREEIYGQEDSRPDRSRYSGYSTFVMGNGDKVFLRWEGAETVPSSRTGDRPVVSAGTWQVVSGTGRYRQIRGKWTYRVFAKGPVLEENILEVTF
jgi:hypothetical protein